MRGEIKGERGNKEREGKMRYTLIMPCQDSIHVILREYGKDTFDGKSSDTLAEF